MWTENSNNTSSKRYSSMIPRRSIKRNNLIYFVSNISDAHAKDDGDGRCGWRGADWRKNNARHDKWEF